LTAGTNWTVTVAGVAYNATAPNSISVGPFVNGSYPYTVSAVTGYLSTNTSGTLVINGAPVSQLIVFSVATHTSLVTFTETGLKAGTAWSVVAASSIGGATATGSTASLSVNLPNGTYTYTPRPVTGYKTPAGGTFNVTFPKPVTVNITYAGLVYTSYVVTFSVAGPTGFSGAWSIAVNGTVLKGSGAASVTTTLGNGSYSWGLVSFPTGYTASVTAGNFPITGAAYSVSITATAVPAVTTSSSPAWTYLSTLAWVLIGVLALLVIIFLALALMAGRRPPSSPPESWTSSSTTETKDNKGGGT